MNSTEAVPVAGPTSSALGNRDEDRPLQAGPRRVFVAGSTARAGDWGTVSKRDSIARGQRGGDSLHGAPFPGASEELFKAVFETSLDAVFILDARTLMVLAENRSARELYGYSAEEFSVMTPMDVSAEAKETRIALAMGRCRVGKRLNRKKDGTVFPVEIAFDTIEVDGTPYGVVTMHDLSARTQLEVKSNNAEAMFSAAFRATPDAVNVNRLSDGLYLEINKGFTLLTGYSQEDVRGRTSLELNIWDDPRTAHGSLRVCRKTVRCGRSRLDSGARTAA